jgi:hypothetical protein
MRIIIEIDHQTSIPATTATSQVVTLPAMDGGSPSATLGQLVAIAAPATEQAMDGGSPAPSLVQQAVGASQRTAAAGVGQIDAGQSPEWLIEALRATHPPAASPTGGEALSGAQERRNRAEN